MQKTILTFLFLFAVLDFIPAAISAALLWQFGDKWAKKFALILLALAIESLTVLVTYVAAPPTVTLSETPYGFTRLGVRCMRSLIVWRFGFKIIGIKLYLLMQASKRPPNQSPLEPPPAA